MDHSEALLRRKNRIVTHVDSQILDTLRHFPQDSQENFSDAGSRTNKSGQKPPS